MQRILRGFVDFAIMFNLIFLLKLLIFISKHQKKHFVWDGQILDEVFWNKKKPAEGRLNILESFFEYALYFAK